MIKESDIEKSILEYLELRHIFAWKARTVGIWDAKIKAFRKNKGYMKGVADILGIYKGKPLAIEVKTQKGYPSEDQKYFLNKFREEGGIAFIARSIEDVDDSLK